jgi:hypothetical protein
MVGKSRGAKEYGLRFFPAGENNAEVTTSKIKLLLLVLVDDHLDTNQVLDGLALFDGSPGCDARLVSCDGVAICSGDFERAVGEVYAEISFGMLSEMVQFAISPELSGHVAPDAWELFDLAQGGFHVLPIDHLFADYGSDLLLFESATRDVSRPVFPNRGPEVHLINVRITRAGQLERGRYIINESIGEDIVVIG